MAEPCETYARAARLVKQAAALLDPVVEKRELEDMAQRLNAASREVHQVSCLPWLRILASKPSLKLREFADNG